jgi:protein TonB
MDFLYLQRERLAGFAALALVVLLLSPVLRYHPALRKASVDDLITITTVPFVEAPPVVEPPPPQPVPRPVPVAQPPRPAPVPQQVPTNDTTPVAEPVAPPVTQAAAPATAAPAPAPVSAPAPVAPTAPKASLEETYLAGVRSYLNSTKRYPTGREASLQRPQGTTRVWFVLARDGRLLDAGVDESSDSLLLDRTALATVQRGAYPPFPQDTWVGQSSHRFTVELEFRPT